MLADITVKLHLPLQVFYQNLLCQKPEVVRSFGQLTFYSTDSGEDVDVE